MNIFTHRLGLLALVLTFGFLTTACEEALTDSTEELVPEITEANPWVEFSGSQSVTSSRGTTVSFTVEPGEAIGEEIDVSYEVSGTAESGTDYEVLSANPVTIPFNGDDVNLDDTDIQIELLHRDDLNENRSLTVTLTSATSASGTDVLVGRGGTEIDQSRSATILPSLASISAGPNPLEFETTTVGLTSQDTVEVTNSASFRSSEISNLTISGDDSDQFSIVSPTGPTTVAAGETVDIIVEFNPDTPGEKSAELSFETTNDPDDATVTVDLAGTGVIGT